MLKGVELVSVSTGRIVISLRLLAVSNLNEYFISFPVSWRHATSRETMTDLFRRGEVLPEGRMNEEEEELISAAPVESAVDEVGGTRVWPLSRPLL